MTPLQALFLGILQGATEFLPISSSGHLVLLPWLLNWQLIPDGNLAFDVLVHLGTLVAVLIYFRRDILLIIKEVIRGIVQRDLMGNEYSRLGWFLVIGSIPAGLLGFFLESWFEELFNYPLPAAIGLLFTAGLLFLSERIGNKKVFLETMKWTDALKIGFGQALAIMPGISRSGTTIATGLVLGMDRSKAARFSFLLGIPVIASAGLLHLVKMFSDGIIKGQALNLGIGFISAAIVGYFAIHFLIKFIKSHSLYLFTIYCLIFASFSLVIYAIRN